MSFTMAGKTVGRISFGMAGLTGFGKVSTEDAIATLKAALYAGANFWNAGEIYGKPDYNSLHLLNAYFTKYPGDAEKVVISVKSCFDLMGGKTFNDTEGVRACIDRCLAVLDGKCKIDIFEPARLDPNVPVEETVRAIAEYVKAGKIGSVGLSECGAASIRKASAVTPISAVEIELSLFETGIFTNGVADVCKELNIPIVAYSPLNKGFLTGQLRKYEDMPEKDYRQMFPRFQPDVFDENLKLVEEVERLAKGKGYSAIQVAIAWVAAQSETIGVPVIPIPGASSVPRVDENMKEVTLSKTELEEISAILEKIEVKGGRAPARFSHFLEV